MKNNHSSVDGFIPRRPGSQLGEFHDEHYRPSLVSAPVDRELHSGDGEQDPIGIARPGKAIGRSDIDESLREIDSQTVMPPRRPSRRERKAAKKLKKSRTKRIIKWVIIAIVVLLVGIAGYVGYQVLSHDSGIFKGNLFDILTQKNVPLQQDSNGRTNILVLGTSQDDPGHQGGNLTDSMMILSIDQTNKNAYMISIPRDLWVQYGQACGAGYQGKINAYYSCVSDGTTAADQQAALTKTANFVGNMFGLNVQYGVNVDYTVFRDVVNAVGGSITVNIKGDGPVPYGVPAGSVLDQNFDWKCGATESVKLKNCPPDGHYIQYTAGTHVLDAEHALYLAQARGDCVPTATGCAATYGFIQSNFDREKNQQVILKAVRDKAMSAGFLTNIPNVLNLITSLGDNLHTTFQTDEIKTLVNLAQNIPDSSINSISLIDSIDGQPPIMTTGPMPDGESAVEPSAGLFDYSDLQALMQQQLSSDPIVRENAQVAVYNGSSTSGVAQTEADTLKSDNFNVTTIDSAPTGTYPAVELFQIGTGNSATKAKLQKILGVTAKTTAPPFTVDSGTDFVIILGQAPTSNQ